MDEVVFLVNKEVSWANEAIVIEIATKKLNKDFFVQECDAIEAEKRYNADPIKNKNNSKLC